MLAWDAHRYAAVEDDPDLVAIRIINYRTRSVSLRLYPTTCGSCGQLDVR